MAALSAISSGLWQKEVARWEAAEVEQNLGRVRNELSSEFAELRHKAVGCSLWAASYTPPKIAHPSRAHSNPSEPSLLDLGVNLALLLNQNGQAVLSKGYDLETRRETPVPQSFLKYLSAHDSFLRDLASNGVRTGIVLLPEGPLLIAACPVTAKQPEEPARATLILGRYLDAAMQKEMMEATHLSLSVPRLDDPQLPAYFRMLSPSLSPASPVLVQPVNAGFLDAYYLVSDIDGHPALLLDVTMPRTLYQQGFKRLRLMMLFSAAAVAACLVLGMFLLDRLVTRRLAYLYKDLERITGKGWCSSSLLAVDGADEVAALAGRINGLLQIWRKGQDELDVRVQERSVELSAVNASLEKEITSHQETETALRDSTGRLQEALTQLKTFQKNIIQQERLRALGQMASGIAHDFNNALSPVLGYSELILHRPQILADPEKLTHYLRLINKAVKDAGHVINRLREFYRTDEGADNFKPVDLNKIVEDAVDLTRPRWHDQALGHGVTIEIARSLKAIPAVNGNEAALREALINLILNAVDALPQGGRISFYTQAEADTVELVVADTGTGMSEEVRKSCFEPFYTTKGERGTGLGLPMVRGIVQKHGGSITLTSEPGKGSFFCIRLPALTAPPAELSAGPQEEQVHNLNLLLVDDEPSLVDILAEFLQGDGHAIETATCGIAAWHKFEHAAFDVVVLDRSMPDMTGDELAVLIKRTSPRTRVIMLTGFGEIMKACSEKPAGVDLILCKPITIEELRHAITAVVRQSPAAVEGACALYPAGEQAAVLEQNLITSG